MGEICSKIAQKPNGRFGDISMSHGGHQGSYKLNKRKLGLIDLLWPSIHFVGELMDTGLCQLGSSEWG